MTDLSKPFDPADAGTPESEWEPFVGDCRDWSPGDGPLVVVSPHPDDEILAVGGLIHTWALLGREVTVVSVTDGEAAYPEWKGLDLVRRAELKSALRKLSLTHVSVVRVGLPDGRVSGHLNRLRNALTTLAHPAMTLIGPFENDGHPDHDATGRICIEVARSQNAPLARYPLWTWHHSAPQALNGLRFGKFALTLDARRAKARAIECFASQLSPAGAEPIIPRHVLTHFQRACEIFAL